ncbi:MAG: zf-HC2 domain-containing protein [Planctomycetes bacterium]|nr:zf-HC2 domain-containing protein [Planctomycetota bacterium]MCC7170717.1 zf-HC2 domain-containing protein [Planctomycetota bacterium]
MKCERARKLLALGVGKDLDVRAQAAFDEHVAGCLSCFREVAAFRRSRAAIKAARPQPDRADLAELSASILARVDAGEPGPVAPLPNAWRERLRFALPLAAVFVGCAWAGLTLFHSGAPSTTERGSAVSSPVRSEALTVTPVKSDQLGEGRLIVIPAARVDRPATIVRFGDPKVVRVAPIEPWKIVRRADDF